MYMKKRIFPFLEFLEFFKKVIGKITLDGLVLREKY